MATPNKSLFPAPQTASVEVLYVKLADGRIVARTPDELQELPDELRAGLVLNAES